MGRLASIACHVGCAALAAGCYAIDDGSVDHLHDALGTVRTYVVVYRADSVPADADARIADAGGTLVYRHDPIGVVIARSSSDTFGADVLGDARVEGASATGAFASALVRDDAAGLDAAPQAASPAPGSDTLSSLQWDMVQIHSPEARAITGGSPSVVVAAIDTGLDYTHPDLAPNVDFADSASCLGGVPNTSPGAWLDDNGNGTHIAGTIAAAKNGVGIIGVAPNVKIAAIKAGDADGYFYPEAVVCAFMWAASHHVQVASSGFVADSLQLDCKNDPAQRAIWEAERRAVRYAQSAGVLVVAAVGNAGVDVARRDCAVPVAVPGVLGVSANGNRQIKSFYSSYGLGTVQLVAPGGDSTLQLTAAAPNGRVLSTWPTSIGCARKVIDASTGAVYCYRQSTGIAAAHVSGVAALVASQGVTSPGAIAARLESTADPLACPPDTSIYSFFTPQTCQGAPGAESFDGRGQVDALSAVAR